MMNEHLAMFPSLSTAVYVMFFSPIVILIGGKTTGITEIFCTIPELSVAVGAVQSTIIEFSLLGKLNVVLFGQLLPNDGG